MPKECQIFHICEDEKFINSAIEQFEHCFQGCNTFYVLPISLEENFKHVKIQDFVHKTTPETLIKISTTLPEKAIIVLHSLSPRFYDFVLRLPKSVKVIWFCFGFEVYNDANYFKNSYLLDVITRKKFPERVLSSKEKLMEQARPFYRLVKPSLPLSPKEYKHEVIKRIDHLGSSFEEEFAQVCKIIKQKKIFFDFWYYPLEQILDVTSEITIDKKSIIIGNSGFKTGNHLDVFNTIKNYPLDNIDIIVPLNYGESKYIQEVLSQGEKYFLDTFNPLLDYMPLADYNAILESVGVAILNNKRQQAVGNTIALLWFGAKVFLSHKNPFYNYLKRIGIHVYCYETELNAKSSAQFLSLEEIERNRKLLFKKLNKECLAELLKNQILKINA
ncbi:TDP-N-acetylfucosamine:lipid II N-acetylfucosaminyltransferase [Flavobacterium limnosediminis]|uniref:TDP-N-acetylfucosamine:lipid II N-acetylfucosaminyltransferase n=1 Tax=Flavobacterium limnosediminis TaxID=1401027 RepID=UPI0004096D77|nr:TDP-N-acetylfucosamine:lipid II N-acetylfucosaminyltransferase [Flavobacterium limnosediminis]